MLTAGGGAPTIAPGTAADAGGGTVSGGNPLLFPPLPDDSSNCFSDPGCELDFSGGGGAAGFADDDGASECLLACISLI